MKWTMRQLKPGDHIRVRRALYFHHGVYIGNGEVIHFTGENDDAINTPEKVEVRKTSMDFFARNSIVEVAELSFFEKAHARSTKERLAIAEKAIGEKGYDFTKNNCEAFANRCCYKKEMTSQVKGLNK